jgi:hypothetical protein
VLTAVPDDDSRTGEVESHFERFLIARSGEAARAVPFLSRA